MSTGIKISNLTCSLSQNGSQVIPIVENGTTRKTSLSTAVLGTLEMADLSAGTIVTNPHSNQNPGTKAVVFGGSSNYASGTYGTIIGGNLNRVDKSNSLVAGGVNNFNCAENSVIIGGNSNLINNCDPDNCNSVMIGGCSNTISHSGTVILGGSGIQTTIPDFTYVDNLSVMSKFSSPTIKVTDFLVTQNLSVLGDEVIFNTVTTTTSSLSVTNDGTGPALYVQQNGSEPIAHFIDVNGGDIIFNDNGNIVLGALL